MIKLMVKEHTLMLMGLTIMENGLMINNMDSEWNHGQTELSMRETMWTEKKKERAN